MAKRFRHWIPNSAVLDLKLLGGCEVNSAFYPSEINQVSTKNSWGPSVERYTVSL